MHATQKRFFQLNDKVKLNGIDVVITDCIYRGWEGYFYKIVGDNHWYQQGCFN